MNNYEKNIKIYKENEQIIPHLKYNPDKIFMDYMYGCYDDTKMEIDRKLPDENEVSHIHLPITAIDNFKTETSATVNVVAQDTITCAKSMIDEGLDKVIILNFASQDEPGGGYTRGANAQEEDICRVSTLYRYLHSTIGSIFYIAASDNYFVDIPLDISGTSIDELESITDRWGSFPFSLKYEYESHHNVHTLLSENIMVFREPNTYKLLDDPYYIDVLSCAAPINYLYLYKMASPSVGMDINIIRAKIRLMLYVLKRRGYDNIVLGAWGCGAYGNDPNFVAQVFKEELDRYDFKNVRFAIPGGEDSYNYRVFKSIIEA